MHSPVVSGPQRWISWVRRSLIPGTFALPVFLTALFLIVAGSAQAQEPAGEERPTGLPKKVNWTFNFDGGFGAFGFGNSLYTDVRPDPSGDLSDGWMESFIKPALTGTYATGKSQLFGKISTAAERTFAAPPPLVGAEAASFKVDDLHVGWRSGTSMGVGENALELTVGRAQYKLGHGLLLYDGGGEGGSRGGFWSNARKAWEFAGIAAFKPRNHTFEAFYLDRDEVPESDTETGVWGVNYELAVGEASTFGATYLQWDADSDILPGRDGLNVYNLRAFTAPLRKLPGLAFELEYAQEENGDLLSSTAWNAQVAYELSKVAWKPRLSYRYAFFEGDDPATSQNEGFDSLIPGFYDWGTWWQGEIAGEYFLANSNLESHQVRLHFTMSESVSGGLIGFDFNLDQPESFAPGVTSKELAMELDAYCDWKLNTNFTVSFVAAYATPEDAAEQGYGRTSDFTYGMIYVGYSF